MTIHRIPILTVATLPDNTGDMFFEPAAVECVNDLLTKEVAVFKDVATDSKLGFSVRVPKNYVGSAKIGAVFYTVAITGFYIWRVEYESAESLESADPSAFDQTVTSGAIAVPGTARIEIERTLTLTSNLIVADDRLSGHIVRRTSDASDTLAAKLIAHPEMFFFEFADA